MANVLTIIARMRAAAGKGEALAAMLTEQAGVVLAAEPGCLVYRVHRSEKDPQLFLWYETFADDAAFETHRNAPHLAAFRQRREQDGLLDGPVEVEIFRSLTD
ncbi:MAG: putative quinol monooxygenase [Casimicrobiaceae bacterium]